LTILVFEVGYSPCGTSPTSMLEWLGSSRILAKGLEIVSTQPATGGVGDADVVAGVSPEAVVGPTVGVNVWPGEGVTLGGKMRSHHHGADPPTRIAPSTTTSRGATILLESDSRGCWFTCFPPRPTAAFQQRRPTLASPRLASIRVVAQSRRGSKTTMAVSRDRRAALASV